MAEASVNSVRNHTCEIEEEFKT